jgi:hypothetical protein
MVSQKMKINGNTNIQIAALSQKKTLTKDACPFYIIPIVIA